MITSHAISCYLGIKEELEEENERDSAVSKFRPQMDILAC